MEPQVTYLGHKVSKEGIQPLDDKVEAITNAPVPKNVSELKSHLGMINHYQKFLPNLSSMLAPLSCYVGRHAGIGVKSKCKHSRSRKNS